MDVMAPRVTALIGKRHVQSSGSFFLSDDDLCETRQIFGLYLSVGVLRMLYCLLLLRTFLSSMVKVKPTQRVNIDGRRGHGQLWPLLFQYQFLCTTCTAPPLLKSLSSEARSLLLTASENYTVESTQLQHQKLRESICFHNEDGTKLLLSR